METSTYFIKQAYSNANAGCLVTLPTTLTTGMWKVTLESAYLSYSAINKTKADYETLWLNRDSVEIFYSPYTIKADFTTNSLLVGNILGELIPSTANRATNNSNWAYYELVKDVKCWGMIKNTHTITLTFKDNRNIDIPHFSDVNGSYMQNNLTTEKLRASRLLITLKFVKIG